MNDQPTTSQFNVKGFGAPPPSPSGLNRIAPWMKTVATGGVAAAALMYGMQKLPESWRPSSVAGDAAGDTIRHEIQAMKEAKIDMERRIADAQAQAQAKAQADLIAITKAEEARTASLAPLSTMAGLSDIACAGAAIVSGLTASTGWGHSSTDDIHQAAQQTGAVTCGLGNAWREQVTHSQLDAVRQAAAARGAPLQNGAVPAMPLPLAPVAPPTAPIPAAAPPVTTPTTLAEVYALDRPARHYPWDEVMKTRTFVRTLPQPVQDRLFARLDSDTGWDVLVERTRAYVVLATLK